MGVGSYACQIIKNRGQTDKKPLNFVQMIQYAAYGAFFTVSYSINRILSKKRPA